MRRPVLLFGFSAAAGIALSYCGLPVIWIIAICAVFAAALLFCVKNREQRILLLAALLILLAAFFRMYFEEASESIYADREGQVVSISGIITKAEPKASYLAVTVKGREKVLVKLTTDDPEAVSKAYELVGRYAECQGRISFPDGVRNPGGFDYRRYLKGRGIRVICSVSKYRFSAGEIKRPVLNLISAAKGRFLAAAEKYIGEEEFQVLAGLLFGEKNYLGEELYNEFQELGIAHVLAVSGLHVGLLYAVMMKLLRGKRNYASSLAVLASLFIYAALSDFSVSVLRASFMIVLNIVSFHLKRRYDLVCAASWCALVFMLVSPYQLFDSGFQLSFIAAYSMGIALPWAQSKLLYYSDKLKSDLLYKLGTVLVPCIVVQLGMLPLLLYNFMSFSLLTLVVNPFAAALAALLLPAGLFFFAVFLMLPAKAPALLAAAAGPANGFASLLLKLTKLGAALGGAADVPAPPPGAVLLYCFLFFWFFSETRFVLYRRRQKAAAAAVSLALVFAACFAPFAAGAAASPLPWHYNDYSVCFVDVGQGDCIHVQSGRKNILIDGGGSYKSNIAEKTLQPYLLKNGVTHIDLAFATHMDADHSKGLEQLSELMEIETLILPVCEKGEGCGIKAKEILYAYEGMHVEAGGAVFDVLSPPAGPGTGDKNNECIVMRAVIDGVSILFTGDLAEEGEQRLLSNPALDCDVIKIGHHGSSGSSSPEFIRKVSPKFAVISCGRYNIYGHPSERVIDLLSNSDIIYSRTDLLGAVCIKRHRKGRIEIENAAKDVKWSIPSER